MIEDDRQGKVELNTYLGWLTVVLALSLPLYRPWVSLASTLIMLFWLFGGRLYSRMAPLRSHSLSLAVLLFLAVNLLSLLWSSEPGAGIRYLSKYRYLLLVPMLATSIGPVFRRRAVTAFSLAAAVSVILSYGVFFNLFRLRDAFPGNPAPTMSHIDYAMILALSSLLILNRVLYQQMGRRRRLAWVGCFVLVASGLLINIGRSGQLAFAAGLVALVLHWAGGRSPKVAVAAVAGTVLALVLVWTVVPRVKSRADEARRELQMAFVEQEYRSSLGERVAAMTVAGQMFRSRPFLGTGVGDTMPEFRRLLDTRFQDLKPAVYWYPHLHNQYAQVATELGLAGLLTLAWIFWVLVREPYRNRETDGAAIVLASTYLIGFLGDPFFHKQIPLVAFALFAGLISGAVLEDSQKVGSEGMME